jgi:hypothetical protein
VGQVREREARVAPGQLLVRDDRGGGVHAGAARLFRHGDAEQTELADAAQQRDVELSAPVVLLRLRLDLGAREVSHGLPQHGVLFGRFEETLVDRAGDTHATLIAPRAREGQAGRQRFAGRGPATIP